MSRLRFRVWDKQKSQYAPSNQMALVLGEQTVLGFNTRQGVYPIPDTGQPDLGVNRWVIEQWTGLKDSNGVDIYEGDLLHVHTRRAKPDLVGLPYVIEDTVPRTELAMVRWHSDCAAFQLHCRRDNGAWENYASICHVMAYVNQAEVIGNVHEHPNLLS